MSTTTTSKFMVPRPVTAPRGAVWAASAACGVGAALWRGLEAIGQARASRALRAAAATRGTYDPATARQLLAAAQAAEVRAMALGMQKTQPRHAAELMAAADRHERMACTEAEARIDTPAPA